MSYTIKKPVSSILYYKIKSLINDLQCNGIETTQDNLINHSAKLRDNIYNPNVIIYLISNLT